ncbi:two-component response regulator ARR14-like [Vigna unguiculata]|uniref:two-component response regulator ARR14-like n=1 Tax=Vigna unguiculata TaxID=3917 RepID=UPI0010169EB8|nr:two-component response regulator ARR14-like [Vigna unguiculata]
MAQISSLHFSEFPSILNVLVIDSDLKLLEFIKKTCNQYSYKVMTFSESLSAVNLLRERKTHIHLILIEVHMPIMDGYEFLQFVKKERINVPVIMMSEDDSKASAMKAIELGACDYRNKPLCEDMLKNMWIRVFIQFLREHRTQNNIESLGDDNKTEGTSVKSEFDSSIVGRRNSTFRESDDVDESKNSVNRVVWSQELHTIFLDAIRRIGLENAVPKKILEAMNMPDLTRGHVASHLQKYRKFLKQEQQRKLHEENEMYLVSGNKKPRLYASGENNLQPTHPGLTCNIMEPPREKLCDPNVQVAEHYHAEQQTLAHDSPYPLPAFPNISITNNFPESSRYELCSVPDAATIQMNNMQHPQIHRIDLPSSFITISENSASCPQNYNFCMNMPPQPVVPGENNIGQVARYEYNNGASMHYPPQLPQNAGFPNGVVRYFAASTDINDQTIKKELNSMNNGHHNP